METICLHDKGTIESFLRRNTLVNVYQLGDLDDFFWNYTCWYALNDQREIKALALLFTAYLPPTLVLFVDHSSDDVMRLLRSLTPMLPTEFYAHLTAGTEEALTERFRVISHGLHLKMALLDRDRARQVDTSQVVRLTVSDAREVEGFYESSYLGNWFEPRILETNRYVGLRVEGRLVAAGGVHVCSPEYQAGALGSIATHPDYRGRGLATTVTAALCQSLMKDVRDIGLNVKADNVPAIACYRKLGFVEVATYGEYMVKA
jgi:RimJ/RimL family protein N-acetyltransferase